MQFIDFIRTCQANAIFDSGETLQSIMFEDNAFFMRATYDANIAPQIRYQEEGFIHWITKKPVTVNVGWISQKTVGAINRIKYSETLGLPYSYEETNNELAYRANEILINEGVLTRVI